MYQSFDDDDWDLTDTHSGPAGEPDAEDADSTALWFAGLLEDPLEDLNSPEEEEGSDLDESVLWPKAEENCEFSDDKTEDLNAR
jgi:hypothetical protein